MCTRMCMVTKTITIMEDAYSLLARNKLASESFSDTLRRVLSKKRNIMEFAGAWSDMNDEEAEEMKKNMREVRKKVFFNLAKRSKIL